MIGTDTNSSGGSGGDVARKQGKASAAGMTVYKAIRSGPGALVMLVSIKTAFAPDKRRRPVDTAAHEKTIRAYASTGPAPRVKQRPAPKSNPASVNIPALLFSFYSFLLFPLEYSV